LPEQHRGAILLTTRAEQTQPLAEPVTVEQMSEQVGAAFLLHRARVLLPDKPLTEATREDQRAARQICQLMGGLPLALDQAGAYIDETQCTVQNYLHFYQQDQQVRARLLARRGKVTAGHPEPVATTWALAFARVEQESTAAADLLRVCAFLAPDLIPETLLRQDTHCWGTSLGNVVGDPFQWNETVGELLKYALVRRSREQQALSIHRLVQVVIRDQMDEQNRQQWAERAVRAVNAAFPEVEHQTWPQCDQLLPHALLCAELIAQEQMTFPEATRLLNQTGYYLKERARYTEAEPLYQRALAIREQQLGAQHPDTATSLNDLANLYQTQDRDTCKTRT
jgi:Tetratricopeptide repeat